MTAKDALAMYDLFRSHGITVWVGADRRAILHRGKVVSDGDQCRTAGKGRGDPTPVRPVSR
jgi:hypothetical protein